MDVSENKKIMASNIKYYMEKNNLTRQDLCNALGVKYTTLTEWIKGNSYPRIDKIELMANYFGISKSDLVEYRHSVVLDAFSGQIGENSLLNSKDEYYLNDKTKEIAQSIYDNKELGLLFDAAKDAQPEDLEMVHSMLLALKRKEKGDD